MKVGIIREGKNPPDKRVPLSPKQCAAVKQQYPHIDLVVQPSPIRKFQDTEYSAEGIVLQEDLSDCDVLFGVKEVPLDMLIPNKTYFFFSHTIKKQPYNRDLLQTIIDKKIRLIDYECLTDERGMRLLGFGKYAGIVGTYNTIRAYGLKHDLYYIKKAHDCNDLEELHAELKKVNFPSGMAPKIVITGNGRVAHGSLEILNELRIQEVDPKAFLLQQFDQPVFAQLKVVDYVSRIDGGPSDMREFFKSPELYKSNFMPFAEKANVYIACHFWKDGSPFIFTREDAKKPEFNLKLVGDISCDIDGPVASTLRPSTIEDPLYAYDPIAEAEVPFNTPDAIDVMAVDNLPCELPKDASEGFGAEFIKNILPAIIEGDKNEILKRATIAENGALTENFSYLTNYLLGRE